MKRLFFLFVLIFAGQARAQTVNFCIEDLGGCVYASKNSWWMSQPLLQKLDDQTRQEFKEIGITIAELTPLVQERIHPVQTVTFTSGQIIAEVENATDDFFESAFGCAGAVLGCATGTAAAIYAPPIGMFAAKLGCALAGGVCAYTIIKYQKMQARLKERHDAELKEQQAKREANVGGGTGGGGDPHQPKPNSQPSASTGGGAGGTIFDRHPTKIIITESK